MKIKKIDYLGLDHNKVKEQFEGSPVFLNYFSINGYNGPMAIYRSENPNRDKGHKRYMFLFRRYDPFTEKSSWMVSGREELSEEDYLRAAVHCHKCDEVMYSAYRHDYNKCSCGESFIDGGEAYVRSNKSTILLNLLTDEVVERKKEEATPESDDSIGVAALDYDDDCC